MIKFADNTLAILADPILASDTVILLEADSGAQFPVLAAGEYFYLTLFRIVDEVEINEVVRVTGRTGDILNVERIADTPLDWIAGTRCSMRNNAAIFTDIVSLLGDTSAVLDEVLGV